jgi:hypothetical protein
MNFFTKNLSKMQVPNNPLSKIIELIPYTETIIDPKLLDSIGLELVSVGTKAVNNSAIMVLLLELQKANMIELICMEYPSTLGQLFIIKRIQ